MPLRVEPVGMPGFSGSQVFAVEWPGMDGRFVLKSFHATASVEHARFIHRLVKHLRGQGLTQVPEVMPTIDGDTVVADAADRLWELARFMPGVAVPSPTPAQAAAAATALAHLHQAAADLPGCATCQEFSPGIARRIEQARHLLAMPWHRRRDALSQAAAGSVADIVDRFDAAITVFAGCGGRAFVERVAAMPARKCQQQVVLRDIWCDHVLFADRGRDDVTAILDLHAAGVDTPATDLARLLGSWHVPSGRQSCTLRDRWPEAIAAYEVVRPLVGVEAGLIPFFHATAVVFGLDNWFRWILDEQRTFADSQRVLARIEGLLQELPAALAAPGMAGDGNFD